MKTTIKEYTMHYPELPYYLTVSKQVNSETDSVSVIVRSKIHVDKEVILPGTYSCGYVQDRPKTFYNEVFAQIVKRYGLRKNPTRYS